MERRRSVEAALAAWRDAERRLSRAIDGDTEGLDREVKVHRDEYQRLSAANMNEWMARLDEAEGRRANATPSTVPFHEAARDTQEIAAQIWEAARSSDEDTPKTDLNQRTTPRPVAPGAR
jgi:hypothetical protein